MTQGRRNESTSMSVLRMVIDRIRAGIAAATSNPTGPPMSCTTRWKRSSPSASTAAVANRPSPVQL